jgi:hypothetical protein
MADEPPIPPRVMREVEHILDGVARRLFLERLERNAIIERAATRDDHDALDEHAAQIFGTVPGSTWYS